MDVRAAADEARDWLRRWSELAPLGDRLQLVCPPILVGRFARYAMRRGKRDARADDLAARDPRLVALFVELVRMLAPSWCGLEIEGIENVPTRGGALLVGNHNGGLVALEPFFTTAAVWDALGPSRAVYSLGHDFLFDDPLFRRYASKLGVLRAGVGGARRALAAGNLVLVYPGGDLDTFRPFRDRGRIELGGRTGFVELAVRTQVPIIPVVTSGAHEQFVVLTRGDRAARMLHLHEWARVAVLPLVLAIPWGLTIGFVPYVPLPTHTRIAFGAPITWPGLGPHDADDPLAIRRAYEDVRARMQATLDRLEAGRRPLEGLREAARAVQRRDVEGAHP